MSVIDQVTEALAKVQDPELHRSITELGMVDRVDFKDGRLELHVLLTISGCPMKDRLRNFLTIFAASLANLGKRSGPTKIMPKTAKPSNSPAPRSKNISLAYRLHYLPAIRINFAVRLSLPRV